MALRGLAVRVMHLGLAPVTHDVRLRYIEHGTRQSLNLVRDVCGVCATSSGLAEKTGLASRTQVDLVARALFRNIPATLLATLPV